MLCYNWEGIKPDITLLGKAVSGGVYPVSVILADDVVMDVLNPGSHGSTYGGNNMACAVVEAALKVLIDERLSENSDKMGKILLKEL